MTLGNLACKIIACWMVGTLTVAFGVMFCGPILPYPSKISTWANHNVGLSLFILSIPAYLICWFVLLRDWK